MKRKKKNIICYIIVIIVIIILILSIFIVPVSRNNKYKKGILNDIYSNTDIKNIRENIKGRQPTVHRACADDQESAQRP